MAKGYLLTNDTGTVTFVPGVNPTDGATVSQITPKIDTQTNINFVSSPYTVLVTDEIINVDTTGGDVVINMPLATTDIKRDIYIVKTVATNVVYINATGSDQINNTTAISITDARQSVHLESVGTLEWIAIYNSESLPISPINTKGATLAALPACTYANGAGGVGATLTANVVGAFPTLDTVSYVVADRILVQDQVSQLENGVYEITDVGSAGTVWILTRTTDSDQTAELDPQIVIPTLGGTSNKGRLLSQATDAPTVGTDALIYTDITPTSGGGGNVTQGGAGTQVSGQLARWNSATRQLNKGNSNFRISGSTLVLTASSNTFQNVLITNNFATTLGAGVNDLAVFTIRSTSLTTGTLLKLQLTEATLAGGFYLTCRAVGVDVMTIGERGAIVIQGTAGTDMLNINAGNVQIVNGLIVAARASNPVADFSSTSNNSNCFIMTANNIVTNNAMYIASTSAAWTSGNVFGVDLTSTAGATLANASGAIGSFVYSITGTRTSGMTSLSNNGVKIVGTVVQNGAGGTLMASGALLDISAVSTQTAGTLGDVRNLLKLTNPSGMISAPISLTQNNLTTTNFRLIFKEENTLIEIYISDGTDPNGALTPSTAGAICYNCGGGVAKYNTGTNVWVAM